jgi:hypothetical protein
MEKNESKTVLFSVRIPKSVSDELEDLAEKLCVESGKSHSDFKRYLITSGVWAIKKKKGDTTLNSDEFLRLHDPKTHGEVLDHIRLKLDKLEKAAEETQRLFKIELENKNKSWFKS